MSRSCQVATYRLQLQAGGRAGRQAGWLHGRQAGRQATVSSAGRRAGSCRRQLGHSQNSEFRKAPLQPLHWD